ncbi:MAG TPA: hypothetical protein VFT16_03230 [Candidatus Saccharimonadales bacterium]|nr:hypothetical protein [Candidatus Saccharimonadales bacterium]
MPSRPDLPPRVSGPTPPSRQERKSPPWWLLPFTLVAIIAWAVIDIVKALWEGRKTVAVLVALALLAGGGWYGYKWYTDPPAAAIGYPTNPSFKSDDGNVMLTVPDRAMKKGTQVSFTSEAKYTESVTDSKLAFKPVSTPVDIKVAQGSLMSDKVAVTLKYDPKLIPKELNSRQVGMVVYDPDLGSWVPILNAKADPKTGTVTALAPHFSWFAAIVLDPLQSVVEVAGQAIKTVVDSTVTVASWTIGLINNLAGNIVKDLFGIAPELKCGTTSKQVEVSTASALDMLSGCVEAADKNDRLRLRNGYAFPMLTRDLPKGITLAESDIWDNGADIPDLIRSSFWASNGKMYLSGASLASATVTPDLQKATLTMDIDSEAVATSIGLAVLMAFSPSTTAAKAALRVAAETVAKGKKIADMVDKNAAWVQQTYGTLDCIVGASHEPIDSMFGQDGYETAADVAHDCLGTTLDGLNLEGALSEVLSSIKVIPQVIQTVVYGTSDAVLASLPQQLDGIKMKPPAATVIRKGTATQPSTPKDDSKASTPATSGNWGNFKSLVGTWKGGVTTLVIKEDATGIYGLSQFTCLNNPDTGTFTWCVIKGNLSFMPGERSSVWFGTPSATVKEDGAPLTPLPETVQYFKQFAGNLTLADDGHSIILTVAAQPGTKLEYCDSYMLKHSNDPSSPHWARCDGNP